MARKIHFAVRHACRRANDNGHNQIAEHNRARRVCDVFAVVNRVVVRLTGVRAESKRGEDDRESDVNHRHGKNLHLSPRLFGGVKTHSAHCVRALLTGSYFMVWYIITQSNVEALQLY